MCWVNEGTPSVTLGGSNIDYVKPGEMTTNHVTSQITGNETLWSIQYKGLAFGNPYITADNPNEYAVFDTQVNGFQVSEGIFDWFKYIIQTDYSDVIIWSDFEYAYCDCSCDNIADIIPQLSIGIGNYTYNMP